MKIMINRLKIILLVIVASVFLEGCGPKNYEDCVLNNLKGTESDAAAGALTQACRNKFPKEYKVVTENKIKPSVDIKAELIEEKSFSNIELGDSLDALIYKKGKGEEKERKGWIWYEADRLWIGLNKNKRVSIISYHCNPSDKSSSEQPVYLNGVSCYAPEADLHKRYGDKAKIICFNDQPEVRSLVVQALNISFGLNKGVVSSFAVSTNSPEGVECIN